MCSCVDTGDSEEHYISDIEDLYNYTEDISVHNNETMGTHTNSNNTQISTIESVDI